jgi:hypothetical protein
VVRGWSRGSWEPYIGPRGKGIGCGEAVGQELRQWPPLKLVELRWGRYGQRKG